MYMYGYRSILYDMCCALSMLHQVRKSVHECALAVQRLFNFIAEVLVGLFPGLSHTKFIPKPVKVFLGCELQQERRWAWRGVW